MPTAEARVPTERPGRYLVQLCKHFSHRGRHLGRRLHGHPGGDARALHDMRAAAEQARVDWSDTEGTVDLPWGRITLQAAPGVLVLRAEADSEEDLGRLRDLVGGHVERFGRRDGLRAHWRSADAPPDSSVPSTVSPPDSSVPSAAAPVSGSAPRSRRGQVEVLALSAVVVAVLAVHLGLGSLLLANWRWTGWAVGGLLAVVLAKAVLLGGLVMRRARPSKSR
jgi:hypothetical protein